MKLIPPRLLFGLLAGVLVAGAAGYEIHARAIADAAPTHLSASPVKITHNAKLGRILVTTRGLTLYYFKRDRAGHSSCSGACSRAWPPLLTRSAHLGTFHLPAKLGTVSHHGGKRQVTYNGWPLYRFAGDRRRGDTRGQGILGLWFAATPGLHAANSTPPPTATASPTPTLMPLPTTTLTAAAPPPATVPAATSVPTATSAPAPSSTAIPYMAPPPTATPYVVPPPLATPTTGNCIPGNNGGDMDGDNNGDPSDDDGCQ